MNRGLIVFVISIFLLFLPALSFAQTQSPKKVEVVFVNDTQGSSYILQDVEVSDFNGVKCIKGTSLGAGWAYNRTVYVPVDRITQVIEEDSLDQYKADTAPQKK